MVESGILHLKYFFDVSEGDQEKHVLQRISDPMRQWTLSPVDVESCRQ